MKKILNFKTARLGRGRGIAVLLAAAMAFGPGASAWADSTVDGRIDTLEKTLQDVLRELETLKKEREEQRRRVEDERRADEEKRKAMDATQQALMEEIEELKSEPKGEGFVASARGAIDRVAPGLRLGAYGEHHFNWIEGSGGDQSDIHRFVLYLGYEFNDWLRLHSETEIEHGFIEEDNGELVIEQLFAEFLITKQFNIRLGRVLHPAGIMNRYHEPTTFYSVERPTFSSLVLPSTWSIDGVGAWGSLTDWLSYEVYLHAGLDGSGFSADEGIREGRQEERPGLADPGVSGRVDFRPLVALGVDTTADLRLGFSGAFVGTDNANRGGNNDTPGHVTILAGDGQFRWERVEVRGELAWIDNTAAEELTNGAAREIFGWYAELALHVWPTAWRTGVFEDSDLVTFVRYDNSDTQFRPLAGNPRIRQFDRREVAFGVAFFPVHNFVIKATATIADDAAHDGVETPDRFDLGFGYEF
ncbi:MAG: hypothetical protein KC466_09565 [Myxococcales bacterium]|nr:hypothetical protein [Myxococcales bacterium]